MSFTWPKISKENVAYGLTLVALCFSVSKWSEACCCVRVFLMITTAAFGLLVYQKCNEKGE